MVEAAGLIVHEGVSRFSRLEAPQEGGKDIDFYGHTAGRAPDKIRSVIVLRGNRRTALSATDLFHWSDFDHPRITDAVVEAALLFIESYHEVADAENHCAENLRKKPTKGPAITERFAVRSKDLQAASHLPGGGSVFAEKIGYVGDGEPPGKDICD